MATLSQGDRLRQKLETYLCCNPPVFKVGTRDASETTNIRKLRTIGSSVVPQKTHCAASETVESAAGCVVAATISCSSIQPAPGTTNPSGLYCNCPA